MTSSACARATALARKLRSDSDEVRNAQRRRSGRGPSPRRLSRRNRRRDGRRDGEPICAERLRAVAPIAGPKPDSRMLRTEARAQATFVMPLPRPVLTRIVMPGIGAANHARAVGDGERRRHGGGPEDTLKDDGIDGEHRQYGSPSRPGRLVLGRSQIGRMSRKDTSSEAPSISGGRGVIVSAAGTLRD